MSGFAVLPNSVVRDPTLGLAEKGALLVLSGYAGADNGAFPSIATIAKAIGKSERQTKRIMTSLAESGYVTKTIRHDPKTGARRSTLYHLKFDRWGGAVVQRTDLSGAKGQICQGASDTSDTGASDKSDTAPVTPVSPITRPKDQDQSNKRRKRTRFVPPTREECQDHAEAKGWGRQLGAEFFDYFTADPERSWIDAKGQAVKSWKQKMHTWSKYRRDNQTPQQQHVSRNAAIGAAWGELAMGKDYA